MNKYVYKYIKQGAPRELHPFTTVIGVTGTAVLPVVKHGVVLTNFLGAIPLSIFDRGKETLGRKHGEQ